MGNVYMVHGKQRRFFYYLIPIQCLFNSFPWAAETKYPQQCVIERQKFIVLYLEFRNLRIRYWQDHVPLSQNTKGSVPGLSLSFVLSLSQGQHHSSLCMHSPVVSVYPHSPIHTQRHQKYWSGSPLPCALFQCKLILAYHLFNHPISKVTFGSPENSDFIK